MDIWAYVGLGYYVVVVQDTTGPQHGHKVGSVGISFYKGPSLKHIFRTTLYSYYELL